MSAEQAELRLDVEGDGLPYSEAEFQQHYGSSEQWERSPVAVFDEEKGTWKMTAPTAGFAAGGQEEAENGDSAADDNDGSDDTEQQEQQQQQPMSPPPKQPAVEESGAMSEQEAKRLAAIKAAEDFLATREPPAPAPAPVPSTVPELPTAYLVRESDLSQLKAALLTSDGSSSGNSTALTSMARSQGRKVGAHGMVS